jgi:hypothetical protein
MRQNKKNYRNFVTAINECLKNSTVDCVLAKNLNCEYANKVFTVRKNFFNAFWIIY